MSAARLVQRGEQFGGGRHGLDEVAVDLPERLLVGAVAGTRGVLGCFVQQLARVGRQPGEVLLVGD
jgi:hypothetical protein